MLESQKNTSLNSYPFQSAKSSPTMKILETVPEFLDKYRLTKNLPACISNSGNEHEIYYGVSTRTIVGLSNPAGPLYATLPRYLVVGANDPKIRLMAPVLPKVAEAGAVTIDTEGGNTSNNIGITKEVRTA
jgi:hypothetical protein